MSPSMHNSYNQVSSLYFAEDFVDSWYDHTNRIMVTTWFNLSTSRHYRHSYLAKLEAAKQFKPRALIVDTSRAFGVPYPEDQKWLTLTVFPEALKLELEFIINIFPRNSIAKTGVKIMIDFARDHEFKVLEMASFEEAVEFVRSR